MSDNEENKPVVSTVESAMDYVDTPAVNFSSWKVKDLGLQFLLFGMAELSARRAIRLQGYIADLEDTIFDGDMLRELPPKEALGAYKLITEAKRDNLDFIAKTRKEMDWNAINSQLMDIAASKADIQGDGQGQHDLQKMANKLIEAMKSNPGPTKEEK